MKHVKFLALSLSIATLLAAPAAFAQTATTDPVGFSTAAVPVGSSVVVPTLLKPAVFTGNAVIAATTFTPSTNPNWAANAFQPTQFANPIPNYPTHYVEVVEGTYEGYSFDVSSNSPTALTVAVGDIPAPLVGQTVKVVVRPHVTLDTISAGSTGLQDYVDSINLFNSDGTTSTRYFVSPSWVAEDFSTAAGHTIVYPGTGGMVTTTVGGQLVLLGGVKTTKTAIPLYATAVNIVGALNPGTSTKLVTSNIAPALAPYIEGFNVFTADGQLTTVGTYYSDGTNLLDGGFNPLPGNAPDSVAGNRGFSVSVTADRVWVSNSPLVP